MPIDKNRGGHPKAAVREGEAGFFLAGGGVPKLGSIAVADGDQPFAVGRKTHPKEPVLGSLRNELQAACRGVIKTRTLPSQHAVAMLGRRVQRPPWRTSAGCSHRLVTLPPAASSSLAILS